MISDLEVFDYFKQRLREEVLTHPIIKHNKYLQWFSQTELDKEDIIYFTKQFSVFSNQFIVAQLLKTLNSNSLEQMRDAKEILVNELGVVFKSKNKVNVTEIDPEVVGVEGTVDGGTFRFKAAHFEWLLFFAKPLGLTFNDLGKRKHGDPATLFFCDELIRIYGSDDFSTGAGASFAVENWANAGFWKQLIQGLEYYSEESGTHLNLGFFKWHDALEAQHAQHTWDELEELFLNNKDFDKDKFIRGAFEMLDGVQAFWEGLDRYRISRRYWRETRG
jgi:hypothetical protein